MRLNVSEEAPRLVNEIKNRCFAEIDQNDVARASLLLFWAEQVKVRFCIPFAPSMLLRIGDRFSDKRGQLMLGPHATD